MSNHGISREVVVITKPLLNSCHLQPDLVISHYSCFQIVLDSWKDKKKPTEGGLWDGRAHSQSEDSKPSHDGVKEQAFSSQRAFVCSSSPQLKGKCSICMAGKTKATTTALRHTSHLGHGLGLEAWVLLAFCSKTKKKSQFTASQIHDNIRRFLRPRAYHM